MGFIMQIRVEKTGNLERQMTVTLPSEQIDGEVESRLKQLRPRAKIRGFRPGKVPFNVLRQHYGAEVRQEVMTDLLRSSYAEALSRESLNPAGGPSINVVKSAPKETFEYTATFEIYPAVELKGINGLKVERPVVTIEETDLDNMLEKLRRQRGKWVAVERPAQDEDRVLVDFTGAIDGAAFEGNAGQDYPVILGSGRMVAGFEQAIVGLSAGGSTEFDITFPKDYPAKEVAGKKAHFQLTVKEVSESELPAMDDSICEIFGIKEGGLPALRQEVRANMQQELDAVIKRKLKTQVLDALVAQNDVAVPRALVKDEIEQMRQEALRRMGVKDNKTSHQFADELFAEQAEKRSRLGLLVTEIIRAEAMQPDPARVTKALEEIVEDYQQPEKMLQSYRGNPEAMRQIETMVLEDQVVDLLLEKAQVTDQPASFDEIMNSTQ